MKTIIYEESSTTSQLGKTIFILFTILLLVWFGFTVKASINSGKIYLADFGIILMSLFLLFRQALSKFTYQITEDALIVKERHIFGTKTMEIPYNCMDGITKYARGLFGRIKFRYTYTKASSLDNRTANMLVYTLINGKKAKHVRMQIKASQTFYDLMSEKLPNLVNVSLDEVAFVALLRQEAAQRGYDYKEYLAIFEEERRTLTNDEESSEESNNH